MGTFGTGLYSDDSAADLRSMIRTLSKLPFDGDRILDLLLAHWHEPVTLDADGGPTFWLVVADQFERRGIRCARAVEQARLVAASGADQRDWAGRGASASDLRKRAAVVDAVDALSAAARTPRPVPHERQCLLVMSAFAKVRTEGCPLECEALTA